MTTPYNSDNGNKNTFSSILRALVTPFPEASFLLDETETSESKTSKNEIEKNTDTPAKQGPEQQKSEDAHKETPPETPTHSSNT